MKIRILLFCLMPFVFACSDSSTESSNVFEAQVESIEKAEQVEQQILDAVEQQRQQLEQDLNP